ncbi:hypothetical protein [Dehalobacter sp. TeCB1]|uniref:hypothetical protein n=1 Tax=Dehalobacter sp. TeCB1 TaxID=1843715 RepID=UPI00159F107F|nr:hypothetical protein [Dehalobacter sp. TeCB1]
MEATANYQCSEPELLPWDFLFDADRATSDRPSARARKLINVLDATNAQAQKEKDR